MKLHLTLKSSWCHSSSPSCLPAQDSLHYTSVRLRLDVWSQKLMTQQQLTDGARLEMRRETHPGPNQETSASGVDQKVFITQCGRETQLKPGGRFIKTWAKWFVIQEPAIERLMKKWLTGLMVRCGPTAISTWRTATQTCPTWCFDPELISAIALENQDTANCARNTQQLVDTGPCGANTGMTVRKTGLCLIKRQYYHVVVLSHLSLTVWNKYNSNKKSCQTWTQIVWNHYYILTFPHKSGNMPNIMEWLSLHN